MFISKAEKDDLFHRINVLEQTVSFLENKLVKLSASKPEAPARKGRDWSPEQRAQASEQMKKIWMKKKEPRK
jgi:hypothetical protein